MGVTEEAGGAAKEAVKGLAGNPLCLAVVVLAVIGAAFAYFYFKEQHESRVELFRELIQKCYDEKPPEPASGR